MPAKRKNIVKSDSGSDEDVKPAAKRHSLAGGKAAKKPNYLNSDDDEEEVEDIKPVVARNARATSKFSKKQPSVGFPVYVAHGADESSQWI